MIIVKQSAQVIDESIPTKRIERIGRVCYKSEDKIGDGTDRKFCMSMHKNGHTAMLEHYRFIMEVPEEIYNALTNMLPRHFEFTCYDERCIISFNAVALMQIADDDRCLQTGLTKAYVEDIRDELIAHVIEKYDCAEIFGRDNSEDYMYTFSVRHIDNDPVVMLPEEWNRHGWLSALLITDRGITHEIVRCREETSYAQESTRYCNYGKADEITVVDQGFTGSEFDVWYNQILDAEEAYMKLDKMGVLPQMARSVLPTCTKAEIVMTAPIFEWRHFIDIRLHGTTGKPHPLAKELTGLLYYGNESRF